MATQQEHIDLIKAAHAAVVTAMTAARAAQDAYRATLAAAAAEGVHAAPDNPMQLLIANEETLEVFTRVQLFRSPKPVDPIRTEI